MEWFSFPYKNLRPDTVGIQPETDYRGNNSMRQDEKFVLSRCFMRHLYRSFIGENIAEHQW